LTEDWKKQKPGLLECGPPKAHIIRTGKDRISSIFDQIGDFLPSTDLIP